MKILDDAYDNYLKMMDLAEYPDCYENAGQFEAWQVMESIAHTKPRALPCRDCTPAFQRQMTLENRCANAGLVKIARIMQKGVRASPRHDYPVPGTLASLDPETPLEALRGF